MNKIPILLVLVLLLVAPQATQAGEHYVGVRYGAGVSSIYFLPSQSEGMVITPISTGLVYRNYSENRVGLQLELNYAQRGYTFEMIDSMMIDPLVKTVHSQVLELPAILQIRFAPHPNIRAYVNGVLYGAYYMSNRMSFVYNDVNYTRSFSYEKFGGLDFGVGGGLGTGFVFGRNEVMLDARFTIGLLGLYEQTIDHYESLPIQVLVSVTYLYTIGK